LVGQYDSQVAFGQSRALLVWNRLIMPNGRSIVLERQPGADPEGYAGLEDEVDNHWGMLFKAAILSTLLRVGSEAGTSGGNGNSLAQAIRQGASQSFNQTGAQDALVSVHRLPRPCVAPLLGEAEEAMEHRIGVFGIPDETDGQSDVVTHDRPEDDTRIVKAGSGVGHQCNALAYADKAKQALSTDVMLPKPPLAGIVAELLDADHLVIATPVYNYNVPAALKAWVDHIVRKGMTLGFDGSGLVTGKKATVLLASGGVYTEGSPIRDRDIAAQYLRLTLNLMGITEVTFIAAGGAKVVDFGEVSRDAFLGKFKDQIESAATV
jgi:FMN-dependent NADH-azoreductase